VTASVTAHDVVVMMLLLLMLLLLLLLLMMMMMLLLLLLLSIINPSAESVRRKLARTMIAVVRNTVWLHVLPPRHIDMQHMHGVRALREESSDLDLHDVCRVCKYSPERIRVNHAAAVTHHPPAPPLQHHRHLPQRHSSMNMTDFLFYNVPAAGLAAAGMPCSVRVPRCPNQA
jgi:hypothetical protein